MLKFKKIIATFMAVAMISALFASCSNSAVEKKTDSGKLSVVTTIFAPYDFVRQVAGDFVDLTMLLKPGAESHSFDPTPKDIINIQKADVFIYVGGDSDSWVDDVLSSMDIKDKTIIKLMDCVDTVEEETKEGMTPENDEKDADGEEVEYDEHVWTSPKNAIKIASAIAEKIFALDEKDSAKIKENEESYVASLTKLGNEFRDVVNNSKRKEIIVGDRFPLRYFVEEYGLDYYAAFPGCSSDTEASASTIAFLTDKVKSDKIPIVFHIELSNAKICSSICEATGAKAECFYTIHNVSQDDFNNGETYISLMEKNVKTLEEALN